MEKRDVAIGAVLCVLVLIVANLITRDDEDDRGEKVPSNPATVTALPKSAVASAIPHRYAKIEPVEPPGRDFDPFQEWSLDRILKNFMVPPGRIDAATTDELIAHLEAIYTEFGGPGLDIAFEPSGELDPPVAIDHDNIDFASLLKLIGIIAGQEVHIGNSKVTLTERSAPDFESDERANATLSVPPSLLAQRDDPFADPFAETPDYDPRSAFEHFGIVLERGVEIVADHENSTWSITGNPAEVDRIRALVEVAFGTSPVHIAIEHKFFEVGDGAVLEPHTYATQAETTAAINELVSSPDVTTVSYPRILTNPGSPAVIESIVETPYATELDAEGTPTAFEVRMVGTSLPVTASLAGLDRIHINGIQENVALRDGIERDGTGLIPQVLGESDFLNATTHIEGQLFDSNTALVPFQQADGSIVYQFLSARRVDASGQPIPPLGAGSDGE